MALIAAAIFTAFFSAYKSIELAKAKTIAVALANEKLEEIRNMPYNSLATKNGSIYPPGNIVDNEIITRDGISFNVKIQIAYVDDPFDGNFSGTVASKPKDIYPYDYKQVDITVAKPNKNSQLAKLSSNISAKAAETPTDTGIIYLCVVDSQMAPVSEANVTITNTNVDPAVNISVQTPADGCVMIPSLPPDSHNNYHIVVSKEGYSLDQTYPRTDQNPHALQPDANVIIQQVTSLVLAIDHYSTMKIKFQDLSGNAVPNVAFTLEGSKLIYNNPDTTKYSKDFTADANGEITIDKLEFDSYKIKNLSSPYNMVTVSPMQEIPLLASTTLNVLSTLTSSTTNPTIYNFTPVNGILNQTVSMTINGTNFDTSAIAKLINEGTGQEITGTDLSVSGHKIISVNFSLQNAGLGTWDLVVTNPGGEKAVQKGEFTLASQ